MGNTNPLIQLKSRLYGWYYRRHTTETMESMLEWPNACVRSLGESIERALKNEATAEEASAMEQIRALEQRLAGSQRLFSEDFSHPFKDDPTEQSDRPLRTVAWMHSRSSSKPLWTRTLFQLVRWRKPKHALEMGCCLGISASYQSRAMELNGCGELTSMEGNPDLALLARENLDSIGAKRVRIREGLFNNILDDYLQEIDQVDYAFIDGNHDEQATWDYFNKVYDKASPQALLIFDDIRWSDGMQRVWKRIRSDPRIRLSVDLGRMGVCCDDPELENMPGPVHFDLRAFEQMGNR